MAVKKKKNMTVFSTEQRTEQTAQPQSHGHITSHHCPAASTSMLLNRKKKKRGRAAAAKSDKLI